MKTNNKIRKGTTHLVVMAYNSGMRERGEIVSQHRSYEAAERKAKQSDFWRIEFVSDRLFNSQFVHVDIEEATR